MTEGRRRVSCEVCVVCGCRVMCDEERHHEVLQLTPRIFSLDARQLAIRAQTLHIFAYYPRTLSVCVSLCLTLSVRSVYAFRHS